MKKRHRLPVLAFLAVSLVAGASGSGCLSITARTKLEPQDKHPIYPSLSEYAKIEDNPSNDFLFLALGALFPFDLVFDTVLLPVDLTLQAVDIWWAEPPPPKPEPEWL